MIVVVKTDPAAGRKGVSLICVEEGTPGFTKGRNLEKIGLHAQDTSELFFDDVHVPAANLLGEEGEGFRYLMHELAQERLIIALKAAVSMEVVLAATVAYTREREAFGGKVFDFQNTRFKLAEAKAQSEMFRVFADHCLELHLRGALTPERAAMAKLTGSEMQGRLLDDFLQLHGGYGYMWEYPIARAWADAAGDADLWRQLRDHEGDHCADALSAILLTYSWHWNDSFRRKSRQNCKAGCLKCVDDEFVDRLPAN